MKGNVKGSEPTPTFTDVGSIFREFEAKLGFTLTSEDGLAAAREAFAKEGLTGESKVSDILAAVEAKDPEVAQQIRELLAMPGPGPIPNASSAPPSGLDDVNAMVPAYGPPPYATEKASPVLTVVAVVIGMAIAVAAVLWLWR